MSSVARNQVLNAAHTIGGLLPADMLQRVAEGKDVPGAASGDYGLPSSLSVRDAAERSWEQLKPLWKELRVKLPEASSADPTGQARNDWLGPLFHELGFGRLEDVGAVGITADSDPGKIFEISHRWRHVPVHIVSWDAELDRRVAGVSGGSGVPPQSLVQECLNRSDALLWGLLTNGRQIRLLRDSNALATTSYVEFDLEAIFDGELFSDFILLYRLLHVSRFETQPGGAPSTCWLEKWRTEAIESGVRALKHLRQGVQEAISVLGTGFLRHPRNGLLSGEADFDVKAFHGALLRLVYRLIFLFVAEDRDLLHPPTADELSRQRYSMYFSTAKLRRMAARRRGTSHGDLYEALQIVLRALGDVDGRPELGLAGLGGLFDDRPADAPLHGLELANEYLLEAVRRLSRVKDESARRWRSVDYRNMDSEELGSIYEWLLESEPRYSASELTFELEDRRGNERKKTGSYYTPSSLIEKVLDESLDPVIEDAVKRGEAKAAAEGRQSAKVCVVEELLALTVCDPACGSAHFLVAAARRIAKRVAAVREANPEPTVEAVRHALHEVITRCIYGVDLNPMAVELAKVSLWLEALEPGRPLGFLDPHIKLGNALIGATPRLLKEGIPDKAFKPVEGDDPEIADFYRNQNKRERESHQSTFLVASDTNIANTDFAAGARKIVTAPSDTLRQMRQQEAAYASWAGSADYRHAVHIADAWCAAFVWHKTADAPTPITQEVFLALQDSEAASASAAVHAEIDHLSKEYHFFHWHLEFPEVFAVAESGEGLDPATGWSGGFDCVLANPPWDKLDFEDKKYFSVVEPSIAALSGAARREAIAQWEVTFPEAAKRYQFERRKVKSTFLFAGKSGAFAHCAAGLTVKGVNSLQVDHLFVERFTAIVNPTGRVGSIVPTALATGAGAQYLFGDLAHRRVITSLYDFENRKPFFEKVDSRYKFCLISLTGRELEAQAVEFSFFLLETFELDNEARILRLAPKVISDVNPNTGSLPNFRTSRDARITVEVHARMPIFFREGRLAEDPWTVGFTNLFNSTDDSDIFRTLDQLSAEGWELDGNVLTRDDELMLPVYEGKMAHIFDHRWNQFYGLGDTDYEEIGTAAKCEPATSALPRRWVASMGTVDSVRKGKEVQVPGVSMRLNADGWHRDWLYGWRDIARAVDERTAIPAFIPKSAAVETFPLMIISASSRLICALSAAQSSLVFDYVARQKGSGAHLGRRIWKQLPVPTPAMLEPHIPFILPRVLELVYTAYDMTPLARDLGDSGEPFRWDEGRRAQLRAELDAYFFHLYGLNRDDTDYVLETFQSDSGGGLKNNEIAKYGTYRTKDLVLAEYDRMADAPTPPSLSPPAPLVDGSTYTSPFTPPPGHGPRHPARPQREDG